VATYPGSHYGRAGSVDTLFQSKTTLYPDPQKLIFDG